MGGSSTNSTESCSNIAYDYNCPCCEFYKDAYAILFPWVVEAIGVVVSFILIQTNSPIPYAAVMFILGALLGVIATLASTGCCDALILSTLMWTKIDSHVLLISMLPGLILRDAMEVNYDVFMLALPQLLLLAYPMVLLGTVLTAVATYYCLPYDWPLSLRFTLGAILGTTDPIACGSVLKRLGAPPRLHLHLAGESTLNDGSAMVFFNVFSQTWLSSIPGSGVEKITVGRGFALFFQNALGGFAVGIAFAIGLLILLYQLDKRMEPEYDILQAGAAVTFSYLSYYVAEQVLHMSGITATVTCAILAKAYSKGVLQNEEGMINYLSLMEFLLNTLMFSLGGVVWGSVIVTEVMDPNSTFRATLEWIWLFVLYLLVIAIRFVQVGTLYPILSRIGLKTNIRESVFVSFAGIRGAVGIALALSLYRKGNEQADRNSQTVVNGIFFLAGGITLCTLLINGTAASWVLLWLKLTKPSDRKRALELFEVSAEDFILVNYRRLLMLPRFRGASYHAIQKHVPFVKEECEYLLDTNLDASSVSSGSFGGMAASVALSASENSDIHRFSMRITHLSQRLTDRSEHGDQKPEEELEKEIHHMFLDLVYHSYVHKLQQGEIDDDNAMQNNPEWMRQNLDVFFPSSSSQSANDEFDHFASAPAEEYWWNRLEIGIRKVLKRKNKQSTELDHEQADILREYQQIRPMVQRTLAFIGAHRSAEKMFVAYVEHLMGGKKVSDLVEDGKGSKSGEVTEQIDADLEHVKRAVRAVLEESHHQIEIARAKLDALPTDTVQKVRSHVVASILLKKLAHFVTTNVQDETLTPKEAQVYLDLITAKKNDLKECTGNEIPLISLSTGNDSNEDSSHQASVHEDPKKQK